LGYLLIFVKLFKLFILCTFFACSSHPHAAPVDAGNANDGGSVDAGTGGMSGTGGCGGTGGSSMDSGMVDSGTDSGIVDAGHPMDSGIGGCGGTGGSSMDSGTDSGIVDAGHPMDSGTVDSGNPVDAGNPMDSGTDAGSPVIPVVASTDPVNGATGVSISSCINVAFNEAMDPATLTTSTVILSTASVPVPSTVTYDVLTMTATLCPVSPMLSSTAYVVTVTTDVKSAAEVALAFNVTLNFTTHVFIAALPVNLGTAGGFVILTKAGVSVVPIASITGNVGVSPIAATGITGLSLTMDASNVFSTSVQVVGQVFASDYAPPTPSNMTTAISDMETAAVDAAGRPPSVTELGAGDISGMTITPGVYKWGTGVLVSTDITLSGSPTDVFIFEIAQNLTVANGAKMLMAGGVLPANVFWQVTGAVNSGTTSHLEGIFLCDTAITLDTGASVNGRLLAQTAVVLDQDVVTQP
jgi:hypothetical protein